MVSWLTCIIGSSGKTMRKRSAISWGDQSSSSQVVTCWASAGWSSLAVFGRSDDALARQRPFHAP
jgi:hypothetical protein